MLLGERERERGRDGEREERERDGERREREREMLLGRERESTRSSQCHICSLIHTHNFLRSKTYLNTSCLATNFIIIICVLG